MPQLVMYWKNDGIPMEMPAISGDFAVVALPELEDGVEKWLDIVQYGLSDGRKDFGYYKEAMLDVPSYEEDKCFFITYKGEAVATITVLCDRDTKKGTIHMVACDPKCRGMGIGNMLVDISVSVLKANDMQTASLLTDDFRIPAIKTYLRGGFQPDLSTEDFVQRWDAIYTKIGVKA